MNKKGSTIFVMLMFGILFFVLGLALAPAIREVSHESMTDTTLNCSTTDSDYNKAVCTSIDLYLPLFTGLLFGLAGMLFAGIAT